MGSGRATTQETEIERRILSLLYRQNRRTFSSLAEAIPEYTWHELLRALNRLRNKEKVELTALQWDYEILLLHKKGGVTRTQQSLVGASGSHE